MKTWIYATPPVKGLSGYVGCYFRSGDLNPAKTKGSICLLLKQINRYCILALQSRCGIYMFIGFLIISNLLFNLFGPHTHLKNKGRAIVGPLICNICTWANVKKPHHYTKCWANVAPINLLGLYVEPPIWATIGPMYICTCVYLVGPTLPVHMVKNGGPMSALVITIIRWVCVKPSSQITLRQRRWADVGPIYVHRINIVGPMSNRRIIWRRAIFY